ncbi:hypothetical protein D3OALGA1CA_3492 [Olavius algarvensis associated proteobacterium Delta 3]|nr:hypothetical protein D3OALGA1CA_3492 [Olavius algarvensis associated proteobacterium Delta 3]
MGRYGNSYRAAVLIIALSATIGMLPGDAPGQNIYTWTDEDGTLHITDKPPPDRAESVNVYEVTSTGREPEKDRGTGDMKAVKAIQDYERLQEEREEAEEKAEKARKKAIEARRKANIAVAEADRVKAETAELAKKTTKRKQERLALERQREYEIKTVQLAQEAVSLAQESEDLARLAEAEAERLRQLTLKPPPAAPAPPQ